MKLPTSEIINYWFPNNTHDETKMHDFWFDKSCDDTIKEKYLDLVDNINEFNYKKFINNKLDKIALLIIGDQFTRNIYRTTERTKNDKWVLELALSIINDNIDTCYPLNMRYFILLPLRHNKSSNLLHIVCSRLLLYSKQYNTIPKSLTKFYNHTISNYTPLTDEIKTNENSMIINLINIKQSVVWRTYYIIMLLSLIFIKLFFKQINIIILTMIIIIFIYIYSNYEKNYNLIKYYNILEQTIVFDKYNTMEQYNQINNMNTIDCYINKWLSKFPNHINMGISLSGGVDSMVILHSLYRYRLKNPNKLDKIIAIHIEHTNRDESKHEREFLESYCKQLNITMYYRIINYARNNLVDRDVYEKETKAIRFNLYQYVVKQESLIGICLGHIKDDMIENLFLNIIKNKYTDNLFMMKEENVIMNVCIHRPFINIMKNNIYNYAHYNNVPYFRNTTPTWSSRHLLRNNILPLLEQHFGNINDNLISFGDNITAYVSLCNEMIINPYIESVQTVNQYINKISFNPSMNQVVIWNNILIKIMHGNKLAMISNKSKNNFLIWLNGHKKTQIILSCNVYCYYNKNDNMLYFVNNKNNNLIIKKY